MQENIFKKKQRFFPPFFNNKFTIGPYSELFFKETKDKVMDKRSRRGGSGGQSAGEIKSAAFTIAFAGLFKKKPSPEDIAILIRTANTGIDSHGGHVRSEHRVKIMQTLGDYYLYGVFDDPPNPQLAQEWYNRTLQLDSTNTFARLGLGRIYGLGLTGYQSYVKTAEYLEPLITANNTQAMYLMADLYYHGHGVDQNDVKAISLYKKLLNICAKDIKSQVMLSLGTMYIMGQGCDPNPAEGLKLINAAARAGESQALVNLGIWYNNGITVNGTQVLQQDYTKAMEYFAKAEKAGNPIGSLEIGMMYDTGRGVERDEAKALQYFQKAEASGEPHMLGYIGRIFSEKDDYEKAETYWKRAMALGDANSADDLVKLYESGKRTVTPAELNQLRADAALLRLRGLGSDIERKVQVR